VRKTPRPAPWYEVSMSLSIADGTLLNNGVSMPWLGIGTWQSAAGREAEQAVAWALELGYRHIDTAALYGNEADVGRALRASGIPRDQVFVTTKVWNDDLRQRRVREAFELSLKKLGLDRVDLYLVHWPVPGAYIEAWRVLEDLLAEGRTRAIGVSNFLVPQLEILLSKARVVPAVNQVEWHPWLQQPALAEFCREHRIVFQAWSPLMQGRVGEEPALIRIGRPHGKSPAQVAIRWGLQRQVVIIPKSVRRERIAENAGVFDFELSAEEISAIDRCDRNQRLGADPADFHF
jgi:diketogulonate reductase-like aldo/keto reductase